MDRHTNLFFSDVDGALYTKGRNIFNAQHHHELEHESSGFNNTFHILPTADQYKRIREETERKELLRSKEAGADACVTVDSLPFIYDEKESSAHKVCHDDVVHEQSKTEGVEPMHEQVECKESDHTHNAHQSNEYVDKDVEEDDTPETEKQSEPLLTEKQIQCEPLIEEEEKQPSAESVIVEKQSEPETEKQSQPILSRLLAKYEPLIVQEKLSTTKPTETQKQSESLLESDRTEMQSEPLLTEKQSSELLIEKIEQPAEKLGSKNITQKSKGARNDELAVSHVEKAKQTSGDTEESEDEQELEKKKSTVHAAKSHEPCASMKQTSCYDIKQLKENDEDESSDEGERSDDLLSSEDDESGSENKNVAKTSFTSKRKFLTKSSKVTKYSKINKPADSGWISKRKESEVVLTRIKRKQQKSMTRPKRRRITTYTTADSSPEDNMPRRSSDGEAHQQRAAAHRFAAAPVAVNKRKKQVSLKSMFNKEKK